MKTPDHTTAQVFPEYIGGEVIADSAALKWAGLFVRRYRFRRFVDSFLVPATAEPLIAAIIAGSAEFEERESAPPNTLDRHLLPCARSLGHLQRPTARSQ